MTTSDIAAIAFPRDEAMKAGCPVCGAKKVLYGHTGISGDDSVPMYFYPRGLKLFSFNGYVTLENGTRFNACVKCGHVWSVVNPKALVSLLQEKGTAAAKEELQRLLAAETTRSD